MSNDCPLILVTNDDGIRSPGLLAAVEALADLGEVMVVAPQEQQTGTGRALFRKPGEPPFVEQPFAARGRAIRAYAVNGSPAMAALYALLVLAPRRPALVVSGINYGENLGTDVTCSGTLGAALEAADQGVPALAASLEAGKEFHYDNSARLDLGAAAHFVQLVARWMLHTTLPEDVDLLKLDVPRTATVDTPWRVTRQWRRRYHLPLVHPDPAHGGTMRMDYDAMQAFESIPQDTDVWALRVDGVVSVTPLSLDMTSRVSLPALEKLLRREEPSTKRTKEKKVKR